MEFRDYTERRLDRTRCDGTTYQLTEPIYPDSHEHDETRQQRAADYYYDYAAAYIRAYYTGRGVMAYDILPTGDDPVYRGYIDGTVAGIRCHRDPRFFAATVQDVGVLWNGKTAEEIFNLVREEGPTSYDQANAALDDFERQLQLQVLAARADELDCYNEHAFALGDMPHERRLLVLQHYSPHHCESEWASRLVGPVARSSATPCGGDDDQLEPLKCPCVHYVRHGALRDEYAALRSTIVLVCMVLARRRTPRVLTHEILDLVWGHVPF